MAFFISGSFSLSKHPLFEARKRCRAFLLLSTHPGDGKRFIVRADKKLTAFVELERQALTVTFYLESIHDDLCRDQ